MNAKNVKLAIEVRKLLELRDAKLVTAESCTAGQIAATLACVPGISRWLCGGFVVYRSTSKIAWLDIPSDLLDDPRQGPVGRRTSALLCEAALKRTPDASWSLAITGDLGPGAPAQTDGVCFVAIQLGRTSRLLETRIGLTSAAPMSPDDIDGRVARLEEATGHALEFLLVAAQGHFPP